MQYDDDRLTSEAQYDDDRLTRKHNTIDDRLISNDAIWYDWTSDSAIW